MSSQSATAVRPIIYLGMDVHKESITIAVLPGAARSATRVDRLPNDVPRLSGISSGWRATARCALVTKRAVRGMCCTGR